MTKSNIPYFRSNTFLLIAIIVLVVISCGFIYLTYGYSTLLAVEEIPGTPTQQQSTLEYAQYVPEEVTPIPVPEVTSFTPPRSNPPAPRGNTPAPGNATSTPRPSNPQNPGSPASPTARAQSSNPPAQTVTHPCGQVVVGAPPNAPCNCLRADGELEYKVECPNFSFQSSYVRNRNGAVEGRFSSRVDKRIEGDLCDYVSEGDMEQALRDPACSASCFDTSNLPPPPLPDF